MSDLYTGANAVITARQYESVDFNTVHSCWRSEIPSGASTAIDIGSGSGRDASALSDLGLQVTAVEKSSAMLEEARRLHSQCSINWIFDSLPKLANVRRLGASFDVVLLSAVWMHLPLAMHEEAMHVVSGLSRLGALVVLSLRAPIDPSRQMYECDPLLLCSQAQQHQLALTKQIIMGDALGRAGVSWRFLLFKKH